jgi:hypothetical protein
LKLQVDLRAVHVIVHREVVTQRVDLVGDEKHPEINRPILTHQLSHVLFHKRLQKVIELFVICRYDNAYWRHERFVLLLLLNEVLEMLGVSRDQLKPRVLIETLAHYVFIFNLKPINELVCVFAKLQFW